MKKRKNMSHGRKGVQKVSRIIWMAPEDLHVTWRERPCAPVWGNVVGFFEQSFDKHLQGPGDDDGDGSGHFPDVLVDLHDLLDSGLKSKKMN